MNNAPFIVITADAHAGASIGAYRDYLESEYHAEFDAWRENARSPAIKHVSKKKEKNWNSALRLNDLQSDGVMRSLSTFHRPRRRRIIVCNLPECARTIAGWQSFAPRRPHSVLASASFI